MTHTDFSESLRQTARGYGLRRIKEPFPDEARVDKDGICDGYVIETYRLVPAFGNDPPIGRFKGEDRVAVLFEGHGTQQEAMFDTDTLIYLLHQLHHFTPTTESGPERTAEFLRHLAGKMERGEGVSQVEPTK